MKKTLVPFPETYQFSSLVDDYLSGNPFLKTFYRFTPELSSFAAAIEQRRKFHTDRSQLPEIIRNQYGDLFQRGDEKFQTSVQSLADENCFTVTTGHQLNLFTGPLYAIYKIATTIKLAETLKTTYIDCNFVPVFWMASEDHDFEEIRSVNIYSNTVTWHRSSGGAVGRMHLEGIDEVIKEVKNILGEDGTCIALFEDAYLNSSTLAEASRKIIHGLFDGTGLIIVDGDDARLKKQFIHVMREDLISNTAFKEVSATSQKLSANYKIQVQPREVNLFFIDGNIRERIIISENGNYEVLNTNIIFTKEEILKELELRPEKFSPNVVLRPVYQEHVLPNLAYIGGPGELNYWLQYQSAFDALKVPFPVLLLRNCFQILEKPVSAKLQKLGISINELFRSTDYLILKVLESSTTVHVGTEQLSVMIQKAFGELGADWSQLDPSLVSSVESEKQKTINGLAGLEEKARRALKRKNEQVVTQVKTLKEKLFPGGALQERHDNFLPFYCRDRDHFIADIIEQCDPFTKQFIVLESDEISVINNHEKQSG